MRSLGKSSSCSVFIVSGATVAAISADRGGVPLFSDTRFVIGRAYSDKPEVAVQLAARHAPNVTNTCAAERSASQQTITHRSAYSEEVERLLRVEHFRQFGTWLFHVAISPGSSVLCEL
ncbi:MAG: hypothetical protein WB615_09695 [Candidatus Tumulicola sp.]